MYNSTADPIRISPVSGNRELGGFITAPGTFYRDDANWVAPLRFEQRQRLTEKNPFFEHARWQAWTARRDEQIVGRISAQVDDLYEKQHGERVGYFGMLEGIDNPDLFARLLGTAEKWVLDQGITTIRGPFNLSINEECGLLVEGFETPPSIMMGHAICSASSSSRNWRSCAISSTTPGRTTGDLYPLPQPNSPTSVSCSHCWSMTAWYRSPKSTIAPSL